MRRIVAVLVVLTVCFSACTKEMKTLDGTLIVPTDLSGFGLPITVLAPDSADIVDNILVLEKGVEITKGRFIMNVDMYKDYKHDSDSLTAIEAYKNSFDSLKTISIIKETVDGIVYKTDEEGIGEDFHFYYILEKNGVQYDFYPGFSVEKNYSLEEVELMFESVQKTAELKEEK